MCAGLELAPSAAGGDTAKRTRVLSAACLFLLLSTSAHGALISAASEALAGRTVQDFDTQTLAGQPFHFADLRGTPVVVSFFASWCAACTAENEPLRQLATTFAPRGVRVLGVLVDTIETPDTVAQARSDLARDPRPFPVLMMNESMRPVFQYEGFPATYFVRADGTFSTTLLGFHPVEQLAQQTQAILSSPSGEMVQAAPVVGAVAAGPATSHPPWETNPWRAFVPRAWKQWHPIAVHFPVALLALEAAILVAARVRRSAEIERFARYALRLAVVSFLPAIYTGISDVGADKPGWAFLNGLQDRAAHFFLLRSSVSLHVLLILSCFAVTLIRLAWPRRSADGNFYRRGDVLFLALTALGLWILVAAGQVGGALSHG